MSNRFQVRGLQDAELLSGLSELVGRCNELTAEMLAHLIEVDQRLLFAELGFPSLFAYCVESLGLSEGAAGRRCSAARVCRRFPEAFEFVALGHLHLSALCGLSKYLTSENAAELFEACRGKARREVDEMLAARFPRPDAPEMMRRLPERRPQTLGVAGMQSSEREKPPAAGDVKVSMEEQRRDQANAMPRESCRIASRGAEPESTAAPGPAGSAASAPDPTGSVASAPGPAASASGLGPIASASDPIASASDPTATASDLGPGASASAPGHGPIASASGPIASGPIASASDLGLGGSAFGRGLAVSGSAPASAAPLRPVRRGSPQLEPTAADRYKVQFTADAKLRELIERACALFGYPTSSGQIANVVARALELFVEREEKRRFAVGAKPRKSDRDAKAPASAKYVAAAASPPESSPDPRAHARSEPEAMLRAESVAVVRKPSENGRKTEAAVLGAPGRGGGDARTAKREAQAFVAAEQGAGEATSPGGVSAQDAGIKRRSRHVPASTRREVYARDQGRCSFVAKDGTRCTARACLEFDHVEPWARMGASDSSNIRLRCRIHNVLYARQCFGALHLAAKVAARRREVLSRAARSGHV